MSIRINWQDILTKYLLKETMKSVTLMIIKARDDIKLVSVQNYIGSYWSMLWLWSH